MIYLLKNTTKLTMCVIFVSMFIEVEKLIWLDSFFLHFSVSMVLCFGFFSNLLWELIFLVQEKVCFLFKITKSGLERVFCFQNCSDLLWEKIVLVICKNFEISRTIYSSKFTKRQLFLLKKMIYFLTWPFRLKNFNLLVL